jgi:hypothetical protein
VIETLIESIRAAVADDATADARAAGANACRTLLAAFEPPSAPVPAPQPPSLPIAAIASAIRGMPPDQLADLLIAKLRTLVPEGAQSAPAHKFNIPLVKVPTP